mmetsp:Transcript_3073/g.9553  ORF Transcript_3073/g.9553 Transcript_3073/m.9553 type:complete len:308 (+) Transcript_3073:143-1066(+)
MRGDRSTGRPMGTARRREDSGRSAWTTRIGTAKRPCAVPANVVRRVQSLGRLSRSPWRRSNAPVRLRRRRPASKRAMRSDRSDALMIVASVLMAQPAKSSIAWPWTNPRTTSLRCRGRARRCSARRRPRLGSSNERPGRGNSLAADMWRKRRPRWKGRARWRCIIDSRRSRATAAASASAARDALDRESRRCRRRGESITGRRRRTSGPWSIVGCRAERGGRRTTRASRSTTRSSNRAVSRVATTNTRIGPTSTTLPLRLSGRRTTARNAAARRRTTRLKSSKSTATTASILDAATTPRRRALRPWL